MKKFEENTVKEFDETKYEELVGKYIEYKEKEKLNRDMKEMIVSELDAMLHIEQTDHKEVFINALEEIYECKYVDRNVSKVDYALLSETVSDNIYNEIVTNSTSTYLKIGPKSKKKEKKERPIPKAPEVKPSLAPKAKLVGIGPDINKNKKNPFQKR